MKIRKIGKDKKTLVENFLSLSFLQLATYIYPIITLPYLVKVLGSGKYGIVAFAWSFNMFFQIIIDFGFNLSATKDLSVNRMDKEKVSEIFSSVINIKLMMSFICFFILLFIIFTFEKFKYEKAIHIYTFIMVIGNAMFPKWFFQGIERMKYITALNILMRTIFLVTIFVFIKGESDYIYVPLLTALGEFVAIVIAFYYVIYKFDVKYYFPKANILYMYLKNSTQFFLSRVSVSLFNSSSVFFLGFFVKEDILGCYAISQKLFSMLKNSYTPIVQTLYPYIAYKKNVQFYKKIFKILVISHTIAIILIFPFVGYILDILFDNVDILLITRAFQLFLFCALMTFPSILLGYPFLAAMGFPKYPNLSVIWASIIYIGILLVLYGFSLINVYSIIFAIITAESFTFIYRVIAVKRNNLWK
ncbi:MAG: oligosaccharide flippase family protein [Pseudomonadota bacterium]